MLCMLQMKACEDELHGLRAKFSADRVPQVSHFTIKSGSGQSYHCAELCLMARDVISTDSVVVYVTTHSALFQVLAG